jgi:hypothetical protein
LPARERLDRFGQLTSTAPRGRAPIETKGHQMKVIISSTGERFGRCGFVFKRTGAEFEVDGNVDATNASPPRIGKKTFEVLVDEAKNGRLSIVPVSPAGALEAGDAASRIAELEEALARASADHDELFAHSRKLADRATDAESQLAMAKVRIAELEAAAAKKEPAKAEAKSEAKSDAKGEGAKK